MIYQVAAIFSVLAIASANVLPREQYEKHFFEWMKTHEIKFANGAEFVQRLQVFADNFDYIEESNAKNLSYKLGLNAYSHLTTEEFSDYFHIGAVRPGSLRRSPETPYFEVPESTANPASVDWTTKGAVTGVKNQGNCGSCWSFSATGALEGIYKISKGSLQSFSEQQLVSCDKVDKACNGGWMDDAFDWIKGNGGLCTESAYPYTSGSTGQTGTCYTSCSNVAGSKVTGYTDVKPGSVTSLEAAVAQQPVSIAIQANQKDFQSYKSGVLTGKCGQRLDHGVLLVGYGTDNGTPFWKVKNSWGTSWGEAGYIRILKDNSDLCGVLDAPSYPKL